MNDDDSRVKYRNLKGFFYLGLAALLIIAGILVLIYPPGTYKLYLILSVGGGVVFVILTYLYWAIRSFKGIAVLNYRTTSIRRIVRLVFAIWVIVSLGVGTIGIYTAVQVRSNGIKIPGPYLTWSTGQDPKTEMTICWQTENPSNSIVRYGTSPINLDQLVKIDESTTGHFVALSGLLPNTTYYYQAGDFTLKAFKTAPLADTAFSVLWWSDPRTNNDMPGAITGANLPEAMYNLMEKDGSDFSFSICTGDTSTRAANKETWRISLNDLSTHDFAANWSHQLVIGNHERSGNSTAEIFKTYYPYKENPSPASFCNSFDFGNTHFVMMDPWNVSLGWWGGDKSHYAEWLRQDLLAHNASTFTVLSMHPNPVLIGDHSGDQTQIMNVAREFGVDLILCGHHHHETHLMNGTSYEPTSGPNKVKDLILMLGTGGNSGFPFDASFAQLDFTATTLTVRVREVTGSWGDTFVITA